MFIAGQILLGLVLLVVGGELLVRGASALASALAWVTISAPLERASFSRDSRSALASFRTFFLLAFAATEFTDLGIFIIFLIFKTGWRLRP